MDTNKFEFILRQECPVCGMLLWSDNINDIPHPIHTNHATAHSSYEWMKVINNLTSQRDGVIKLHNEKVILINEMIEVLTLAQHEILMIQHSCRGSIGNLNNIYLPQMDATKVDKVAAKINEILERVKGCTENGT